MLSIKKNSISLTRGDNAIISINIYTPDGKIYELQNGDKIIFCVREQLKHSPSSSYLLKKEFYNYEINIQPQDTNFLDYGQYLYDCSLILNNGEINTICNGTFTLTGEIL